MSEVSGPDLLSRVHQAIALQRTDPPSAFREFQALSDQGCPEGMLQLAWCYQVGQGTKKDSVQAEIWYCRAQENGSEDVKKQVRLYHAIALQKLEPARAFAELHTLSLEGYPASMVSLARCYQNGIGTRTDTIQAETWYRRAFETGSGRTKKRALYYLGRLYFRQENYAKARETFSAGVELNDPPSLYNLGKIYWRGLGVKAQPSEARMLFERASNLGHLLARRNLAILFITGRFGISNFIKGLYMIPKIIQEISVVAYRSIDLDIPDERLM